jgi:putative hydrolase of the HAD superfamily
MRVVLLDALGTLVRLEPPAPALAAELFNRIGATVSEAEAEAAIGAEIGYYRAHFDEGRDAQSVLALRRRCASIVAAALPGVGEGLDEDGWLDVLLASLRFTPFADVKPALAELRRQQRRLVVVSNWDWSLHLVLERLGMAPLLDGVVTSAEVGARKPAREIFARGLALAGADAGEALHVGDSVAEDVEGARAAGITPVLIDREGDAAPVGVRTVRSLIELAS